MMQLNQLQQILEYVNNILRFKFIRMLLQFEEIIDQYIQFM